MTNNELKKKRFELHIDSQPNMDEYCIVDTEQEALAIYNNLGCIYYTSAPALCDLLNELSDENKRLKESKQLILDVIDAKIEEYKKYDGYDTEKYYIGTQLLKELKKELEE